MPEFSTKRAVRHTAHEMFELVADIERYPEFVPLCRKLHVHKRTSGEGGTEVLVADMTVAYKLIRETFTSEVTLDKPKLQVLVRYLDGPFSRLENRWLFRPTGEQSSEIQFSIAYEFRNRALGMLMGAMFDAAFRRFAAAFEQRADKIYGEPA